MFLWTCKWINTGANTTDFIHRIYDDSKLNLEVAIWSRAILYWKHSENLAESPSKKLVATFIFSVVTG